MDDSLTFLHAADLHLDSPFKGITDIPEQVFQTMRESTFKAFDSLIETAIHKEVDFVLLVGDLFDENKQSLKAQLHLRDGFLRLREESIDVFLSYGNHDYIKGNIYPITYPDNVYIFPDETVTSFPYIKDGRNIANIYGFSYLNQDVKENKAKQFTIKHNDVPFNIAMLHGSLHGNKEHDPYAPFRLEDLLQEPFDYWALGHIHKRTVVQQEPPIVYPGNIQGRHRNEAGTKGCYYVEMNELESSLQFIPLQHVTILNETLDIRSAQSIVEIKERIIKKLAKDQATDQLVFVHFTCEESQYASLGLKERLPSLIDVINEKVLYETNWSYIYGYEIERRNQMKNTIDTTFMREIKGAAETIDFTEVISDLYNHPQAKNHLQIKNEHKTIERAIQYITNEMSNK